MKNNKLFISLFSLLFLGFFVSPQSASADTTATLLPTGEGNYLQWTPKTGTTHYTMVDEASCNANTDYVSTDTLGKRDSYQVNLSSIPNGSTITQIALTPCASKNNGGGTNSVMNVFYRVDGVDSADAGSYTLTNTTPSLRSTTTYSGLSIGKSSTTTLEIGAVFASGNKGARLSQISSVITYTPPVASISAPTNLNAIALGTEAAKLTWVDNATNETGYKIERSTDSATFVQINTVGANATSYVDPNVVGTYYYRVRAYNATLNSDYSNTANVTVPLNAPFNLAVFGATGSAFMHWNDASNNEDGFKIERSSDNINFSQVGTVSANVTQYTDTGLSSGLIFYRVKAYKGVIDSVYSNSASTTVL